MLIKLIPLHADGFTGIRRIKIMRHIIIRSIMAIIWIVVAAASLINGGGMLALVYVAVGVFFGINAIKMYKKMKEEQ